jgi:hypothetical protein
MNVLGTILFTRLQVWLFVLPNFYSYQITRPLEVYMFPVHHSRGYKMTGEASKERVHSR